MDVRLGRPTARGRAAAGSRTPSASTSRVYAAIARTPTPTLDRAMARLSHAADYSRLSLAAAAVLAASAGAAGRRAAATGLAVGRRHGDASSTSPSSRSAAADGPTAPPSEVPVARHVRMPTSTLVPLRALRRRVRLRDRRRPGAPAGGDPAARTRRRSSPTRASTPASTTPATSSPAR